MSLLDTIMFWRKSNRETVVEHVEGFEVEGCFTLPGARLDDLASSDDTPDDSTC